MRGAGYGLLDRKNSINDLAAARSIYYPNFIAFQSTEFQLLIVVVDGKDKVIVLIFPRHFQRDRSGGSVVTIISLCGDPLMCKGRFYDSILIQVEFYDCPRVRGDKEKTQFGEGQLMELKKKKKRAPSQEIDKSAWLTNRH